MREGRSPLLSCPNVCQNFSDFFTDKLAQFSPFYLNLEKNRERFSKRFSIEAAPQFVPTFCTKACLQKEVMAAPGNAIYFNLNKNSTCDVYKV